MPLLVAYGKLTLYADAERELTYSLLIRIEKEKVVSHTQLFDSYRNILELMGDLEADIPRIKSYLATFAAKSVSSDIVTLAEIAEPTENGNHFPFLLLVLQQLGKTMEKNKVVKLFEESKVNFELSRKTSRIMLLNSITDYRLTY